MLKKTILVILLLILVSALISGCGSPSQSPSSQATLSQTAIPASEAKKHIGERTTVYGVVASTNYAIGSKGKPTFINLDKPYPNPVFTVLIWDNNRKNFPNSPETYYKGKTIYVTGLIIDYQGVPEIEVTSSSQIQEK